MPGPSTTTAEDTIFADFDFDAQICRAWLSRKSKFRDAFNEEGNRKALHILHQLVDLRNTRKLAWAKESEKLKEKLVQACGAQKAEAFIKAHDADDEKEPDLFKRLDFWINQALTHEFDDQIFDDRILDAPDNGSQASPGPPPSLPSPESTTQSSNPFSLGAPVAQMDLFEYPPKTTNASTTGVQLGSPVTEFPSKDQNATSCLQHPLTAGQHLSYNASNETSEKPKRTRADTTSSLFDAQQAKKLKTNTFSSATFAPVGGERPPLIIDPAINRRNINN